MECIFCKIIAGDIPTHKIYEDDRVMAFLDILPISPGHTIIVPRSHVADMEDVTNEDLTAMSIAMKKIGKAMIDGLDVKGYSIFMDNKSAANQHVPHIHFHIVPRKEGDGLERWPQGGYEEGGAEFVLDKLAKALS